MATEDSGKFSPSESKDHSSDLGNSSPQVEALISQLSQEEQQDEKVFESQDLLFDELNTDKLRERETEYTDVEKHFVRSKAWLKVARELAPEVKAYYGRGLRYFTLPGFNRLDVGLLLRDGLLAVDPNDSDRVYVAGFEADPSKFGRISGRFPKFKLLANSSVESALTDPKNRYYSELQSLFPFDIINLDLTTSLTPQHEGPYSTTMQAINSVLRLQAGYPLPWALFLTFRNVASDWEQVALGQLFENLQKNIGEYPAVRDAFYERHREHNVENLQKKDIKACISQAVVKWLVDRAHSFNIRLKEYHCFEYCRRSAGLPPYTIFKQVLKFSQGGVSIAIVPMKATPRETWMQEDLVRCINSHKPLDVEERILVASNSYPKFIEELQNDIKLLCSMGETKE